MWEYSLLTTTADPPERAWAAVAPGGDGPVEEFDPPHRFVEVARLPLARVRTAVEFRPAGGGSVVRVTVRVTGPLGFLWRRLTLAGYSAGVAGRARRFVDRAGSPSPPPAESLPRPTP